MILIFFYYLRKQKKSFLIVLALFIAEILLIPALMRVVPDTWYLRTYLPWTAVLKTERFVQGRMHILPNPQRGWHNQQDDFAGNFAENSPKVLILGDSRMNFSNVTARQTVTHFLAQNNLSVLNQATEMYGLDQTLLTLKESLEKFQPEFIVIALGTETGGHLACHYMPFLYPMIGLPLLKPKFVLEADSLKIVPVDPFIKKKTLLFDAELLAFLKENDPHYQRFVWFKQRRTTPFLGLISFTREWLLETRKKFNPPAPQTTLENQKILVALILESKKLAKKSGTRLIYLLLPRKNDLQNHPESFRLLSRLLEENSIEFISTLNLFRENDKRFVLFDPDGIHFTALANALIAQEIVKMIQFVEKR